MSITRGDFEGLVAKHYPSTDEFRLVVAFASTTEIDFLMFMYMMVRDTEVSFPIWLLLKAREWENSKKKGGSE